MYFFKDSYLVAPDKHPYLKKDQITQHNLLVMNVEKMSKRAAEIESRIEKNNSSLAIVIGLVPALVFLLDFMSKYWQESPLLGLISLSMPTLMIFGLGYGVVYGLARLLSKHNPELESLGSSIKESVAYLDNELRLFENMKKKQAQHWLSMTGHLFEKEVAELFRAVGYKAQVTKGSGDGGIDIFLEKDGIRYGVQCKNYHGMVGPAPIRDLYGTMTHEKLEAGIFIASSGFTKGAREFASDHPIRLLDINDILRMHASTLV